MKGVLFSADFAVDSNNDPRLIELNTDTVMYAAFTSSLSLNNLTDVINANSDINEFHIIYKEALHGPLVELVSSSVAANCSGITTYGTTKIDLNSVYPTSPTDSANKFILRMAYDENAVFDSTYAKSNVNMLKLMYDNNATSSIGEYYHSSSIGEINTLTGTKGTSNSLPDYILKSAAAPGVQFKFFSVTGSVSDADVIKDAAKAKTDSSNYIEKYYYSSDQVTNGLTRALRSYNIMYGTNLDIIKLASGSYNAIFDFATTDHRASGTETLNELNSKHFYEFTNKFPQNKRNDGFLGEELIELPDGNYVSASVIQSGSTVKSFFYSGSPNTDDMDIVDAWSKVGYDTPVGSFERSASVHSVGSSSIPSHGLQQIEITGSSDYLNLGSETRVMVYATSSNITSFVKANKIIPGEHFMVNVVSSSLLPITQNYFAISETVPTMYTVDVEPDDTIYLKVGSLPLKISTTIHNYKEE